MNRISSDPSSLFAELLLLSVPPHFWAIQYVARLHIFLVTSMKWQKSNSCIFILSVLSYFKINILVTIIIRIVQLNSTCTRLKCLIAICLHKYLSSQFQFSLYALLAHNHIVHIVIQHLWLYVEAFFLCLPKKLPMQPHNPMHGMSRTQHEQGGSHFTWQLHIFKLGSLQEIISAGVYWG